MIKGLLYESAKPLHSSLRSAIVTTFADLGVSNLGLVRLNSTQDILSFLQQHPKGSIDLIICHATEQEEGLF